jgi:hypothetical protein
MDTCACAWELMLNFSFDASFDNMYDSIGTWKKAGKYEGIYDK